MNGGASVWAITPEERGKHDKQFDTLAPVLGYVSGEQARKFFLQSGLPPSVLAEIWNLADMDSDGKMDRLEFSIAMKLIKLKLQGRNLPSVLPVVMKQPSVSNFAQTSRDQVVTATEMADLSLYLTNVNVSLGQTMESEKNSGGDAGFERVEMGDSPGMKARVKVPRRTVYFASGETMEEFSTDDEEEEEEEPVKKDVIPVDPSKLTWGPYFWFYMWRMGTSTITVCDYMGERLASLFGITTPKYQYAIDEYYRMKKEEEEEAEEERLSQEAERRFAGQRRSEQDDPAAPPPPATVEQPEACGASFVNISFELEPEPPLSSMETVPSPLPS